MLDAIAGADSFARRWDTPLVGRTVELGVLRDGLTASADGHECRLVTVIGAAGVGKTRLVSELVAEVGEYATVAAGRCLPYGDGITFWPLTELIQRLGGEQAVADAMGDDPDAALVVERLRVLGGRGSRRRRRSSSGQCAGSSSSSPGSGRCSSSWRTSTGPSRCCSTSSST